MIGLVLIGSVGRPNTLYASGSPVWLLAGSSGVGRPSSVYRCSGVNVCPKRVDARCKTTSSPWTIVYMSQKQCTCTFNSLIRVAQYIFLKVTK